MAEVRKIIVEISNKDGTSDKITKKDSETNTIQTNLSAMLHPVKSAERFLLGESVILNQAFNVAKNGIINSVNLTMNRYFNMKEDYIGQKNFDNFMTGVNLVSSIGASVIGGAIVGSKAGVGGAIIGAGIGAVGSVITNVISYEGRMSSYYSSLNASNYQNEFSRIRAGLTNGSKGTEN